MGEHMFESSESNGRRQAPEERKSAIASIRNAANTALRDIDAILDRHEGKRLSEPNALGSVPVETTADGIRALADSSLVQTILEDQSVALMSAAS